MSQRFGMSAGETVEALVKRGVPRAKALRAVGIDEGSGPERRVIAFPLSFTLPWTALVSENRRFAAHGSRIVMTPQYKHAREKTAQIVRRVVENAAPVSFPLSLDARVYFPDNRIHDAPNFAGATHNALKHIVFTDDQWLYKATWERMGVDPDAPRAEIVISRHVVPALLHKT